MFLLDLLGFIDSWSFHIPVPLALALVATIGYLLGRRRRPNENVVVVGSRRELRRAQLVARELENISLLVRQHLATHHGRLQKYKHSIAQISGQANKDSWKDLCREAEEMLKPTLQLATQIASAYDEIRQQTNYLMSFTKVRIDPLTGVRNRRALDGTLASQFALMLRYNTTFTIALFDIDNFKQINDQQGHLQGDHILQETAKLLDESIRKTDTLVRYGGEEFVVVMPETELDGACVLADRLRERVQQALPITISGGVTIALDGDNAESLLDRADAALYSSKTVGRNCTFRHDGQQIELITQQAVASQPEAVGSGR